MIVSRSSLEIGNQLGTAGGQGTVYALRDHPKLAYKEYHAWIRPHIRTEVLKGLIALKDTIALEGSPIQEWAAWPLALVEEHGQTLGFLMPRIDESFYFDGGGLVGKERSFMFLADSPRTAWGQVTLPHPSAQLLLLERFAGVLQQLHHRNIVIGDISYANLLWNCSERIFLMDCDSFTLNGARATGMKVETRDWEDTQSSGLDVSPDQDCYKLGLLVHRVLSKQLHGIPSSSPADDLAIGDPQVRQHVYGLLSRVSAPPGNRPTAQAWRHALQGRSWRPISTPTPPAAVTHPRSTTPERKFRPIRAAGVTSSTIPTPAVPHEIYPLGPGPEDVTPDTSKPAPEQTRRIRPIPPQPTSIPSPEPAERSSERKWRYFNK